MRRNNPSFPSSVSHDISYLIAAASTRVVKWGEGSIGRITWRFVEVLCISCYKCHQTFTCVNSWRSHEEEHWNEVIKMIELNEKSSVQKTIPKLTKLGMRSVFLYKCRYLSLRRAIGSRDQVVPAYSPPTSIRHGSSFWASEKIDNGLLFGKGSLNLSLCALPFPT